MANLVSVQQVATRMGMGSTDSFASQDKLNQLFSAITGATLQMAAVLRTTFARTLRTDRYYVDSQEKPYTDQFPKLYLSQGFVDDTQPIYTRLADNHDTLATADALAAKYVVPDAEKGLLMVTGSDFYGEIRMPYTLPSFYAQAEYTAGFTEKSTEFGKVYVGIPGWLEEAAIQMAINVYRANKPCDEDEAEACVVPIRTLLEAHIRFFPSAIKPML